MNALLYKADMHTSWDDGYDVTWGITEDLNKQYNMTANDFEGMRHDEDFWQYQNWFHSNLLSNLVITLVFVLCFQSGI